MSNVELSFVDSLNTPREDISVQFQVLAINLRELWDCVGRGVVTQFNARQLDSAHYYFKLILDS